ncbi:hypothetical protein STEG23_009794 [Scotinomys teguina]
MAPSTSAPKSPPPLEDDEEEGEEEDEESPVTEPPIGQSYQKLSFCFIERLKSACANYGPTAPFTLALLENQSPVTTDVRSLWRATPGSAGLQY